LIIEFGATFIADEEVKSRANRQDAKSAKRLSADYADYTDSQELEKRDIVMPAQRKRLLIFESV
jgi:hypothetical protein